MVTFCVAETHAENWVTDVMLITLQAEVCRALSTLPDVAKGHIPGRSVFLHYTPQHSGQARDFPSFRGLQQYSGAE
ncbi:hypothetical protein CDAR_536911 [Caerostris darwini]|uniref:Uncharacterized protein n=1 Tax=Caerostris darwini TaxID=1538125 RepID=A0AAV4TKH2_9ARAC|nr:hypothetical protein CDAR_536911 [Caerostris darwini]